MFVKDFKWRKGLKVVDLVNDFSNLGFQSVNLARASDLIVRMKREGAKIFLTFTSNMVTSGLRGFFAQIIKLGLVDVVITTVGSVEEDVMKSFGEKFLIGEFSPDDVSLYERGINRVGNIFIRNESYEKFEDVINPFLRSLVEKKLRWSTSDLLRELGLFLKDENSFLRQAALKRVPVFCPAITDGAFGFHLFMLQQEVNNFVVDVVKDFKNVLLVTNHDEKKGLISLGGGVSKHHAILSCLLNGGLDYAVYMTTARSYSGSLSGATTNEAKSWGKIKDDSDAVTVIGDVSITFPLVMVSVLERLELDG